MKKVCKSYAAHSFSSQVAEMPALPIGPALQNIADVFVQSQECRHRANYDVSAPFDKAFVLLTIVRVKQAFADFARVRKEANTRLFLADLLLRGRWDRS